MPVLRELFWILAAIWLFVFGIEVPFEPNPIYEFRDQLGWFVLSLALILTILSIWPFARRRSRSK